MANRNCKTCIAPNWTKSDIVPDADLTVLVHMPGADDPVQPGFYDGCDWFDFNGASLKGKNRVTHWMGFPEPPEISK